MAELDILDLNDEVIVQAYQGENYQCFDTGVDSDLCYILFSSHGLYYPNTREVFQEQIVKKDRYEWKWVVKNSHIPQTAGRIIYVRDIYKEWYSKGINRRTDTIDKTLELLKELTAGWKVVTVGSSAGGYMAVLTAVKLKADYCLNFSGQYCISADLNNPYYNLVDMLSEYKGTIFYFLPAHCEADQAHYKSVQGMGCVKSFLFNENKHAATMFAGNMCCIIDRRKEDLLLLCKKYNNKEINKFVFLFQTAPITKVFTILRKELQSFYVRRMGKHWHGM